MHYDPMAASPQYQRNVGLRCPIALGYLGLRDGSFKGSDARDFAGGQELGELGYKPGRDGMALIAGVSDPLKIVCRAVGLDAVNVVDVWQPTRVRDESKSDEPVDIEGLSAPFYPQSDLRVSSAVCAGLQDFPIASLRPIQAIADTVQASDAANVADFIESQEAIDSNGSPLFSDRGIHSAGRLSGYSGLAVKNPSCASTLGGFAHTKARRVNTQVTEA